jgi:hypothetical protein
LAASIFSGVGSFLAISSNFLASSLASLASCNSFSALFYDASASSFSF